MKAATAPRAAAAQRLLHLDPRTGRFADHTAAALPALLRERDLLVLNDAATLPASLRGHTASGVPLEVRLAGEHPDGAWAAVLFGAGDWRQRTEDRPAPPVLDEGAVLAFGPGLVGRVRAVSPVSPRLIDLRFDQGGAGLWTALYRLGTPIQYSYLQGPLDLWSVQTPHATRPWAVELPSAGRPLTAHLVGALRFAGVRLATVTHAAGLSSTGDPALDALLPLPERYDIPAETVAAVDTAQRSGGRVVAVGTTVVRALEGAAARGALSAGSGVTALRLQAASERRVVTGLLTGIHAPGESHYHLLQAFAPEVFLRGALDHAAQAGYLGHEFGDSMLIL